MNTLATDEFDLVDFNPDFDGIDVNAGLDDQPPPPMDGVYTALITLSPTKDSKKIAGLNGPVDVKGMAIRPSIDETTGKLKSDDKGRINGSLFFRLQLISHANGEDLGNVNPFINGFAMTYVPKQGKGAGTSPALSLLKGMGIDTSSGASIADFVRTHAQQGADTRLTQFGRGTALTNLLLLDGMRSLIEAAGDRGYELPAVSITTNLEVPDGTKRGQYDNMKVKLRGSTRIVAANSWPTVDESQFSGGKLKTEVANYASSE